MANLNILLRPPPPPAPIFGAPKGFQWFIMLVVNFHTFRSGATPSLTHSHMPVPGDCDCCCVWVCLLRHIGAWWDTSASGANFSDFNCPGSLPPERQCVSGLQEAVRGTLYTEGWMKLPVCWLCSRVQCWFLHNGLGTLLFWLLTHAPSQPKGNDLSQAPKLE